MLQELPVEVIQQITGCLPTATSIVNLGLTNRKLHEIVSADDYAVFRGFVRGTFPSIRTPPLWRDAARVLTSRSRAWDRRAFIGRQCHPPPDAVVLPQGQRARIVSGYQPVIDSYEDWQGGPWSSRKEVLAWGAGGRLRTRTSTDGGITWSSLRTQDDHRQDLDILDVHLLRPHQHDNTDGETIILMRPDKEVVKVETTSTPDVFNQKSTYIIPANDISCMDATKGIQPILSLVGGSSIRLYPVHGAERNILPIDTVPLQEKDKRPRFAKFLSDDTLAVGMQSLRGQGRDPIQIYNVSPTGISVRPVAETLPFSESAAPIIGRHGANVVAPLDDFGTSTRRPGQMFLSGWTDGVVWLHDTRTPRPVAEYIDSVDDGQILSLLPIGHERFLAGSSQNGCLKTYDLRMTGGRVYSYLEARARARSPSADAPTSLETGSSSPTNNQFNHATSPSPSPSPSPRDFNIFLTPAINYAEQPWEPLSHRRLRQDNRYRGSIYSLSSPSPMSPTVYAGIKNHVMQLDFVCTDDYRSDVPGLVDPVLGLDDPSNRVFDFSCYERPREGRESTDPVLLRKQKQMNLTEERRNSNSARKIGRGGHSVRSARVAADDDGWDERWQLETHDGVREGINWGP
ncbi:hypothetical protein A1O3_02129 [Capronia epimyces CBS 606.96]|uniref:F-box domain-containing protein n=1 Tax=Capronia epimyces CBS 606.96 TaxID=1182542 RepID=W9YHC6_9EURO|nr:uncharacterized protein A1O3_02129 [Capronia epimyces CBS 606.96]EXJ89065.1 hypothetical protein A1O3_02129 [Capronia epimyces CBS 606.96]